MPMSTIRFFITINRAMLLYDDVSLKILLSNEKNKMINWENSSRSLIFSKFLFQNVYEVISVRNYFIHSFIYLLIYLLIYFT